jgi:hypothetical protein
MDHGFLRLWAVAHLCEFEVLSSKSDDESISHGISDLAL